MEIQIVWVPNSVPVPQRQQCLHPGTCTWLPTPERAVPEEEPYPQSG